MTQFTVTISGIEQRKQATAITKSLAALWPELTITARIARAKRKVKRDTVVLRKNG